MLVLESVEDNIQLLLTLIGAHGTDVITEAALIAAIELEFVDALHTVAGNPTAIEVESFLVV